MRHLGLTLVTVACLTGAAEIHADDLPDYDAIRTPDSPAFTLLGISPTQIDRPNTPKQVAVSLGGLVADGGAIEIAPYWLWSHPDLTLAQYKGGAQQLVRNISVSVGTRATAADAEMGTSSNTALAFGVRTSAVLGAGADGCATKIQEARAAEQDLASRQALARDELYLVALAQRDLAAIQARKAAIQASVDTAVAEAANAAATACVGSGDPDARGLALELAAATSVNFAGDELDAAALGASAAWVSLAFKQDGWSAIALARVRRDRVVGGREYLLVPGLRAVYARGRAAGSLEAVAQKQVVRSETVAELDLTYRATVGLDVRVADSTWLTLSFGKEFGDDSTGRLFSLANLTWGFGDPVIKAE